MEALLEEQMQQVVVVHFESLELEQHSSVVQAVAHHIHHHEAEYHIHCHEAGHHTH